MAANPRKLFLVDGLGALVTACVLMLIRVKFAGAFGMPGSILIGLSGVAFVYAVYSLCCSFFVRKSWWNYLKVIIAANVLYCCVTSGLIIYYFQKLTVLGLFYFLGEVAIIAGLVRIELMALHKFVNREV